MAYNFREVERKWQREWGKAKIYESNVDENREKKFITAAFPYPNSPQHIGHARTYTTTDIYARYLRLKGYNVLFPMGFHVTGTPILAMAERIKEGDKELLRIFTEIYDIPENVAKSLTDPKDLVMYFSKEIEEGMKEMGFAIDWRRKFYTFDKAFNKFIEWQFYKLKEKGLIVKGEHPVAWSLKLNSAVGAHDTKGDVDPEIEEITAIKFAFEDGFIIVATYRPETIYGVTNIWINPKAKYVKVKSNGEILYLSKDAYEILKHQRDMELLEEVDPSYFLNKRARSPLGKDVPIYEASFVSPEEGTGIVMSVPAHAPYDYIALRDLGKEELISIISVEGFGEYPAKEIVEKMGIKNQEEKEKLDEATKIVYKAEAHTGIMKVGEFAGMPVKEAKEKVREKLIKEGWAFPIWHIANGPIYSRAGDRVIVKVVKDQWFIDYGNPEWKEKAKAWLKEMRIIPEEVRQPMIDAIDWFKQKACTRARGLGTRFPFDKSQMIEALSDSTIYMAFYTISHKIKDLPEEELSLDFFDTLFLGKGNNKKALELREEFDYWYPLDSRHSGADLVKNHLPFFVMNHVAIFDRKYWPRQVVVNGFVLMEGKKMSKSLGNILPLRKAIREYGADVIRMSVVSGAELLQDSDFSKAVAEGIKSRMNFFYSLLQYASREDDSRIGRWLLSRIHSKLKRAEELYENFKLRQLALDWFYEMHSDIAWYLRRAENPGLKEFFALWPVVISPFMPHFAEEIWHQLGKKGFVVEERFPKADEGKIDEKLERAEEVVMGLRRDIENVIKLSGKKAKKIYIYVASEEKRKAYEELRKTRNLGSFISTLAEMGIDKSLSAKMGRSLMKKIYSLPEALPLEYELEQIKDAKAFFEREFGAEVEVRGEKEGGHEKRYLSLPQKPAIVVE